MSKTCHVDFGAPISEKGDRDEVIAIKLGGGIKNVAEMMFYAMKFNGYDKWLKKYPRIAELDRMSPEERFIKCTYFTEENFLRAMRAPLEPLSQLDISIDTGVVRGQLLDISKCNITSMEVGLHNILSHGVCRKLYIFDAAFTPDAKNYLFTEYEAYMEKLSFATGTLINLVESLPEITTIIIDDIEEVVRMVEYEETINPDVLKYKAFWVASNCSIDTNRKEEADYGIAHKYDDFMSTATKNDGFQLNWFNHSIVSLEKPGNVILPE